ncbi:phosphonate ABC transporter ATP-binding protein [Halopiger xanaduensis]|uniref:Phosphonate ABC transporter, ATPase subunit n=1 Tax=Halopiger xanaduensis (strain DSM 18323 / JCM 14033 / SH-6) TaxID=797210 RepID=F8D9Y8_HALXS|nr:phosphonate ABC transporter ATP-binding protein [Halopiger xanaduensis]AEH35773.1 phosphonate ABC transporter, ATPase subunit [Halopiger xanaduensis SH-6]
MPTIEFENVTKIYGEDTVALDDVSFTIPEGEFVILLGPSGAGKSTMLRVLNGLTEPTEGTVRVGDQEVQGNRSDVGMVFQEHYLIESKTAFGNALTGALSRNSLLRSMLGMHSEADKLNALEALDTVGLLDEAGQRAESMSGGQKQRVGIARALVQEPQLVLADEPVASLDPKAARDVMRYLKKAATEENLTTITSLHQVNIAREFGDRFLGIRDGEVIFDGDADDLTMEEMDRIYYGDDVSGELTNDPTGTNTVPTHTAADAGESA